MHGEPAFVGRENELARVNGALNRSARGEGRVLFLTGEAGIGKSRLIQELSTIARRRRHAVLYGRSELLSADLAYAPILEAFGGYLGQISDEFRQMLASELPQLGLLFDQIGPPEASSALDPGVAKTRLYDGMARLVAKMAETRPVVLIFDDLHWADTASLELIQFVARGASRQRLLLVCAFRASEFANVPALQSLVTGLHRLGQAEELLLQRFDREGTAQLVRALLDAEAPRALLDVLESHAMGIPLFVESIVRSLIEQQALTPEGSKWRFEPLRANLVPTDLKRLILARLGSLDPLPRSIVDLVAVLGDRAPHTLVADLSGLPEEALFGAVKLLKDSGLLSEHLEKGRVYYGLTHPLIGEVAYREVPVAQQQRIHAHAVEALEQTAPTDVERLARHYRGAGDRVPPERALDVCVAAGKRARDRFAAHEAKRHFETALTLCDDGLVGSDLPALLELLGESFERTGDLVGAVQRWQEGLDHAKRGGDHKAQVRLHRHLARAFLYQGRFNDAEENLRQGIALEGKNASEELADLYFTWLSVLGHSGEWAAAESFAKKIAALAASDPSPRLSAMRSIAETHPYRASLRFHDALPVLETGYRNAKRSRDHLLIQIACLSLSGAHCVLGKHAQALPYAREAVGDARRLGVRPVPCTDLYFAWAHLLAGRSDEALACAIEYVDVSRRSSEQLAPALGVYVMILSRMGRLDEADSIVQEAKRSAAATAISSSELEFIFLPESVLAYERGLFEEAFETAQSFVASRWFGTFPVLGWSLLAESSIRTGRFATARETAIHLDAFDGGTCEYARGLARVISGMLAVEDGDLVAASDLFERGAEMLHALALPYEAGRVKLEHARIAKDESRALQLLDEAAEHFAGAGAGGRLAEAQQMMAERRAAGAASSEGLRPQFSERERQVALLVARGLTNDEVAQELFISKRTVTTHLTNIYARFSLRSRVELAGYVRRHFPQERETLEP